MKSKNATLLSAQEKRAVLEFKKRLQTFEDLKIRDLKLFGSRARGAGDEHSDLDILVLLDEAPTKVRAEIFEMAADILLEFDIDISPLVMSFSHYEDMKRRERLLPQDIERDGHPL